ncbi:MAG: cation transporter, partial [Gillisia sp.]
MKNLDSFQLPSDLQKAFDKAKKLEWITIFYQLSVVAVMYLTMGSSQAMKTAWLEDALGIFPSVSFLIAANFYNKKPNASFPYGYHRSYNIAFLASAIILFTIGVYMFIDSGMSLLKQEHPTIGLIQIFGHHFWLGWLMLVALVYSSGPAMILGFKKLPKAKKLHNKVLFTDADTQK